MDKYIVILGAGKNQLPFILESKKLGFKTIVFDVDKNKIGSNEADLFYEVSIYNDKEITGILNNLKLTIDAVIARVTSKHGLQTGYSISKEYNLPFASQLLIKLGTDKSFLSKFCIENNILIPNTTLIKTNENIENFKIDTTKSYIIKPTLTTIGKKNIIKFNTEYNLTSLFILAGSVSENGNVLIQEYIDGIDISVLVKFKNNKFKIIASWDEIIGLKKDNHIKGLGLCVPSVIHSNNQLLEQINLILEKFNNLLTNENYLVVFSFRIKKFCEAYLIEIHADLTGDLIAEKLLPSSNNKFNFFKLVLNLLLENHEISNYDFEDTMLLYDNNNLVKNYNLTKKIELLENVVKNNQIIELPYLNYLQGCLNEK